MENKVTTPLVKGLIISLLLIVYSLIIILTGQITNKSLSYIQYIFLVAGVIIACTTFSKQMNSNVTFGNVFSHGFKTTAVIIIITIVFTLLSFKVLFPNMQDIIMRSAREDMERQGKMSDSDIDKAMGFATQYFITFAIAGIIFMFGIVGAISSLIGAAVAKKNPNNPFEQQPV